MARIPQEAGYHHLVQEVRRRTGGGGSAALQCRTRLSTRLSPLMDRAACRPCRSVSRTSVPRCAWTTSRSWRGRSRPDAAMPLSAMSTLVMVAEDLQLRRGCIRPRHGHTPDDVVLYVCGRGLLAGAQPECYWQGGHRPLEPNLSANLSTMVAEVLAAVLAGFGDRLNEWCSIELEKDILVRPTV
jgi:hypothetical protein